MKDRIADLRKSYETGELEEHHAHAEPFEQFRAWFQHALNGGVPEPNAMTLATAGTDGVPSARMVLLKAVDARGFVFFTNLESRKARELSARPAAALVFFWAELERQVRVEGTAEAVSRAEAERYFASRPRGSRLGAWASRQSDRAGSRAELEAQLKRREEEYRDRDIPTPPFWGGFRVLPHTVEFWQGRENRLHDRLVYSGRGSAWSVGRLQP